MTATLFFIRTTL